MVTIAIPHSRGKLLFYLSGKRMQNIQKRQFYSQPEGSAIAGRIYPFTNSVYNPLLSESLSLTWPLSVTVKGQAGTHSSETEIIVNLSQKPHFSHSKFVFRDQANMKSPLARSVT